MKAIAKRIQGDRRHRNFMVLCEQRAETRAFADWQMGFKRLDPSRQGDRAVFEATRPALEGRIATADGRDHARDRRRLRPRLSFGPPEAHASIVSPSTLSTTIGVSK